MKFFIVSCGISLVFIIGMIYLSFFVDKQQISLDFKKTLSNKQLKIYENIVNYRRNLYFQGYGIGILISIIIILFNIFNKIKLNYISLGCLVASITFIISYFYYILSPKPDYMILHIDNIEQKKAWLKIYKTMQFNYHLGLFLGIVAVFFLSVTFCK